MVDMKGDVTEAPVCSGQGLWSCRIEGFYVGTLCQDPQSCLPPVKNNRPLHTGLPRLEPMHGCTLSPPVGQRLKVALLKRLTGQGKPLSPAL